MASCIDIKAIERFVADNGIDAAPDLVKHLVFKWQSENNTDTEWPSAEYITEQLRGERFAPSEAQLKLYNTLKLNETKSFPTEEALNNYINNNLRSNGIYCFPQSSIYTYRGVTGDYKLSLGLPSNANAIPNFYEGSITPDASTVFVFGSNPEGRHGAGAAKVAREQFGAKYGQGEGLQGNSYALPTKDLRVLENKGLRSISPEQITENIRKMYEVARQNPNKQFKVAYTNGLNETTLNGYTGAEMIKMFKDAGPIPSNVIFSKNWVEHWNDGEIPKKEQVKEDYKKTAEQELQQANKPTELNPLDEIHFTDSNIPFNSIEQAMQTAKWQALRQWLQWYGSKPADTQANNINKILDAIKEAKTGEEARTAGEVTIKSRSKDVQDLINRFFGEEDVKIAGLRNWKSLSQTMLERFKKDALEQNGMKSPKTSVERNTFEPENSRNDAERFADKVESENTISSDRTILTNEELKYWNEQGVGEKPRILVASERTDPAFHVKEILEVLNGDKTVAEWGVVNGKRQKVGDITGKDFAGLYLITKHDGLPMLELLETKIPKLIHFSITTLGGTEFEPGVMKYNDLLDRIQEYLKKGLDPNSVTIRIDPIVPGVTNFDDIETVVRRASEMGINRIRFSVMDAYPNTVAAMKDKYDFGKYYNGFNAKPEYINAIADFMLEMKKKYNVRMGTCAEALVRPGIEKDGCLSVAAINEMLGTSIEDKGTGNNTQRKLCSCYGGKIDALAYDSKCASHCIYCYAKHENDKALEYYDEQGRLKDNVYTRTSRETPAAKPAAPENTVVNSAFPTIEETKEEIAREDPLWENAAWKNVMQDPEFQYASMLAEQGRVLTEQWGIPMSKIEEAAAEIGNYISDLITEVQRNPARAKALLGIDLTQAEVERMTRPELITRISPNRLMTQVKKTKFDTSKFNESQLENEDLVDETDAIFNNWEFVMSRAATIILENEKVQFKYNPKTKTTTAVEKDNEFTNPDDIEGQRLEDGVEETHENQQEWGIESKTLDLLNDVASPLVKDAFRQCYLTDAQGRIVQSERGINKRVRTRDAINQVFAWTVGVQSMNDAIQRLKAKSVKAQWLLPIIARLEDKSGKESDFQNQFWTVIRNSNVVYSVVKKTKQGMKAMDVSSNQVRREQVSSIKSLIQMGEHPLFGADGINLNNLGQFGVHLSALKDIKDSLSDDIKEGKDIKNNPNYKKAVGSVGMLANLLGYYAPEALITENLNNESFNDIYTYLTRIGVNLDRAKGNNKYDAFSYEEGSFGIGSYLNNLVGLLSASLQDTHITSIFDNGKMYQTRVKPSALLTQLAKFQLEDKEFKKFISDTYNLPWFRDTSEPDITKGWRLTFLQNLINNPEVRHNLQHQIQLNYNKKQYMKNMNPIEYTLATIAQFLAENPLGGKSTANKYAWFRIPIQSNKPTSEYLKMKCETDTFFRDTITDRMAEIFDQELSRIQTVTLMNAQEGDDKYIKNFSKRGKEFCFLDFMNVYLEGGSRANTELGKLIQAKIKGEDVKEGRLLDLKKKAIKMHIQTKVNQMLESWEKTGITEAVKDFANIGKDVKHALEVFAWNDALASMNIMELFVHDIAFYDGADDLQKRLAELHAPGIRPNLDARDYQGKPVSDGIHRSIMLADAEGLTSNIIDNVSVVFDRRIQNAPEEQKGIWEDLKEHLVGEKGLFRDINATDGQAYNSPSSFRKKAIMFGKWDINKEKLYQKIRSGKYTPEDVRKAFNDPTFGVLKPTTFGHSRMDTGVAPLNQISVPTYNKNSEYTLLMAEALLAGENTGRPNLLRAIFDVMEESHVGPNGEWKTNGIDTIQFVSAVKSGVGKTVDIASLMEDTDGEAKAKLVLTQAIYNVDKADLAYDANGKITVNPSRVTNTASNNPTKLSYNKDIVRELPYDAFALQMDVANHFKEHEQIFGSQDRMIIPSELPEFNARGEEIMYNTPDGPKNAREFRKAYEDKIAAQIADSVKQVEEELGLTNNSPIERKAAISKLLQREIMSNPRYGMDLYLAVSINPATRDFTIPLGDPVNSKRIESLLNAIIKDRVNKQMISGGPIVQVTSFGTSRRLGIKFKGRNGEILKTKEEFNGTEEMYKRYLQDNQAGIAYMEVYASPYTNKLFEEFADANGVIDIKAIEAVNPELLKMIGYRIPTEAKYSISPLKIVGFLPRECGEGIMLPYEITLLNGSDFDVDKMYVMTKRFDINKKRFGLQKGDINKAVEYLKELPNMAELVSSEGEINTSVLKANREAIMGSIFTKNDLVKELIDSIRYKANVTEDEQQSIKEDIEREIQGKIYDYKKKHKTEEVPEEEIDKIRGEYNYEEAVETYRNVKTISRVKEFLEEDLYRPSETDGVLTSALRKAYLNFMYKVETPKDVKYQRDNDIIDMQWEVLTKEEVAYELLNPGGFDPQKRMGYIINAYKNRAINEETKQPYTYEELCAIKNLKKLASLSAGSSNLMFFDTQVQYYKQNSAAGSLTGIFAVHRTAHAILEGDGLFVDVDKVGKLESQVNSPSGKFVTLNPVTVLGMPFKGRMPIDVRFSRNGEYVGKQLGNSVAAAVDAGKYPVLNLFNVNGITANVYTTLIKMGMPFEDVALFLGQKVISDLLDAHARASVTGYTSIYSLMEEMLNALDKRHKFKTSKVEEEDLTREELIKGLLERNDKSDYKTIRALRAFFGVANACRLPVAATRLNSVTSAVGPLVTDNIIDAIKRENLNTDSNIYDAEVGETPVTFEDIVNKHPILREFNKTYNIADKVFADMPTNSSTFRSVVNTIGASPLGRTFFNDSKLMGALSDFFQTYLAYANGVVKEEETLAYINDFPKAFAHRKYKERFKGNAFIDAIQFETKEGSDKVGLNVDTTGWDQSLKSPISSAWLDLYNTNAEGRKLAVSLVKYFIHKGGVGFTPKTAMNLVPTLLKEKVPNYNEAFKIKNIPSINTWELVDMFIRNNWDNYKLVPFRKLGDKEGEIKGSFTSEGVSITDLAEVQKMQNTLYFRTKKGKEDILLRQKEVVRDELDNPVAITYERVAPLGANGSYVEISTTKASKEVTTTMVEQETSETPYGVMEDTSMEAADDVISNRASTANYLITFGEIDRLTTLLLSNNRDLAKAVERKADTVETNSEDKALNARLEEHFNAELEKIGIQNEERVKLVQDIIDKINPC